MAESEVVETFPSTFWGAAEDVGEQADAGLLVGAEIALNKSLHIELEAELHGESTGGESLPMRN